MRMARVSCISFSMDARASVDERREKALAHIDRAAYDQPDLMVLSELCINNKETPEAMQGPITEAARERARQHNTYIALPLAQSKPDGALYNSLILLDPEGQIVGEYNKMFPTIPEMEAGICPGDSTPVFQTSFGRVGMAICFDLNFPQVIQGLSNQGVELVCFSSAYEGGRQLARWALDYGVYIASAHRGGYGTFIDKTGMLLEKGDPVYNPIITRDLNMDRKVFHLDYNHLKLEDIRKRYGRGIKIDVCRPEAIFALESRMEDVTVEQITQEYELEPFLDYLARSSCMRDETLSKSVRSTAGAI